MGVIQRQSIKNTIVNLAGTVIGVLSILFIVPLEKEIYGYAQWLYSTALVITPIIGLGLPTLIIKYYPEFKNRGRDANFLSFSLIIGFILVCLTSLILYLIYPYLLSVGASFDLETEKLQINGYYILALSVLLFFISCLISYTSTQKRIVIPDIINNVGFKIALPIFILMYYYEWIDERWMALLLIFFFLLNFIILLFYSISLSKVSLQPKLNMLRDLGIKKFTSYLGFSSLNAISYYLVFRLDIIMIGLMLDDYAVGVYAIVMVMANVINIPTVAIGRIASPIISTQWKNNDISSIEDIYKKSSLNIAFVGLVIFSLIFINLGDLTAIMPGEMYKNELQIIFLLIGGGKLIDVIFSLNSQIIMFSAKYRYNLYFLMIQAILNILFNYYFINLYGLVGAALATFLSLVLFNLFKFLYLKIYYKMDFITRNLITTVAVGVIILLISYFVPFSFSPFINLVLRTCLFLILNILALFLFKFNPELLDIGRKLIIKYRFKN